MTDIPFIKTGCVTGGVLKCSTVFSRSLCVSCHARNLAERIQINIYLIYLLANPVFSFGIELQKNDFNKIKREAMLKKHTFHG